MDAFDRDRYATVYRLLAEILERDRPPDSAEEHLPFILGDLARRVFVGTEFEPPDEILEQASDVIRSGDNDQRHALAHRLRSHADHLDQLPPPEPPG